MRAEDIHVVGNLGTGTMGAGTAVLFALAGLETRLYGRTEDSLTRGFTSIDKALALLADQRLIGPEQAQAARRRVIGVTELAEVAAEADFILESVAEDLAVKRAVFGKLDRLCPARTIFATNTSGLSPTEIAAAVERKDQFVAANFWNPPLLLPLVEVMPGGQTSEDTVAVTLGLLRRIGKRPIALKREIPGYIGNRLQFALLREAFYLLEEGIAEPEAIDDAVKYSLGRRWGLAGPLESADLGGLDVFYAICGQLYPLLCSTSVAPDLLRRAVEAGRFGVKTGAGLYDWSSERERRIVGRREAGLIEWLRKDLEQDADQ